ncbi:MAG: hypothetical protein ACKOPQ_09250 [Novosphingobium sp.]|jgi:hypothetical protein
MSMVMALALMASGAAQADAASTVDSDLRCSAWVAMALGDNQAETEQQSKALMMALSYFVGRWEAATGKPLEEGLTSAYIGANTPSIENAGGECRPRFLEMAGRLGKLGQTLQGK